MHRPEVSPRSPRNCASTAMSGRNARPRRPGSESPRWTTDSPNPITWTGRRLPHAHDFRQPRTGAHRRAAQVAADPAQPVHRRRRSGRLPPRHVGAAKRVLADPMLDTPGAGGSSTSRCRTTTSTPAARTGSVWSSTGASCATDSRATPGRFRTRVITTRGDPEPAHRLQAHHCEAVSQGRQSAADRRPPSTTPTTSGCPTADASCHAISASPAIGVYSAPNTSATARSAALTH